MEMSGGGDIHVLCDDALAGILARLPSEAVLRCRAVCERWRRITNGRSFLAAHAARSPREMITITTSLTVSAVPLGVDPVDVTERRRFLCDPTQRASNGTATWCKLLFSLDGLLVFQQRPGLYIICNPVTRQWTNLPVLTPEPCFTAFPCGFYRHSSSGEYRLLCHGDEAGWGAAGPWGCEDYYYVLTAGATQPRRLSRAPADGPSRRGYQQPVAHGEIIYWASLHPEATRTGKILAFNTASETFRLMSRPPGVTLAALLELDGLLCAVNMSTPCATRLDIWALQDHEAERWTLRLRMEVRPPRCIGRGKFMVTTAISDGDGSILIGNPRYPVVLLCDIKERRVRKEIDFRSTPSFMVFSESLVSHDFFQLPRCPELTPLKFPD